MVDAARQMLDELMGRNRNLHPSEAVRKISWEDSDFCQYYIVKFCPHDLFINTRADLGPCPRIHDDEAKDLYEQARPSPRKRQYEDDFLRFCITMLNDVDRKIQKGKQRLQLMNRDQPVQSLQSKYQEQVNNLDARIKKLLSEAEEAGTRGDVDQAQDLMTLCEKLKEEKETVLAQYENHMVAKQKLAATKPTLAAPDSPTPSVDSGVEPQQSVGSTTPKSDGESKGATETEESNKKWLSESGGVSEKQMEVCETCGAFLIVGDAQQRIEDHLMGKQHLGYSKLRKAVDEIHEKRQHDREEEDRKRREEREQRGNRCVENERRRDSRMRDFEPRRHSRDRQPSGRHSNDKYRHHHKSNRSRRSRSHSNSRNHRRSREHNSQSRSRSRSRY